MTTMMHTMISSSNRDQHKTKNYGNWLNRDFWGKRELCHEAFHLRRNRLVEKSKVLKQLSGDTFLTHALSLRWEIPDSRSFIRAGQHKAQEIRHPCVDVPPIRTEILAFVRASSLFSCDFLKMNQESWCANLSNSQIKASIADFVLQLPLGDY